MAITVILADDHVVVRQGLRSYLDGDPDINVIAEAGTGRQALDQVATLRPNVAVLDIAMPNVDGVEATKQICEKYPETGVVILSMHTSNEHVFRSLHAGARGFVSKDSAGSELVAAVHAIHEGHRYLNQMVSDWLIKDYVDQREIVESQNPLDELSEREIQILKRLCDGGSTSEIAEALSLSTTTINTYRSRLMKKLDIGDIPTLVKFAIRHGLTDLE